MAFLADSVLVCLLLAFPVSGLGLSIQDDPRFEQQTPSKGRQFVFAFLDNCLQNHEDATRGPKLSIVVPSSSDELVSVNVTMPRAEFSQTLAIPSGGQTVVQLPYSAIVHGTGLHENGIQVDASDDVFVYGLAQEDQHSRSEGFQALPIREIHPEVSEYVVVSLQQKGGSNRRHSQFGLAGGADITEVSIRLGGEIIYKRNTFTTGDVLNVTIPPNKVLQIKSLSDLSGTRVLTDRPVGFVSGVDCGTLKVRRFPRSGCGHLVEQLPSVDTWGRHFIYRPLSGGPRTRQGRKQTESAVDSVTKIKIVPSEEDTNIVLGTSSGRIERNLYEIDIGGTDTIHITAFKPVLVVAFTLYLGTCGKSCRKRTPTMTLIPPLSPTAPEVVFTTVNATDRNENSEMRHYLSVMYDCHCFRRITWKDNMLAMITQTSFAIITGQICWTQYQVQPGQYHLDSTVRGRADPCFISAYLFGHGTNGGYGYPLGLDGERNQQAGPVSNPSSPAGNEFFIAFVGNTKAPKLSIHRAKDSEGSLPIHGSINSGTFTDTFTIPVGTESIEVELPQGVLMADPLDDSLTALEVRTWGQVVVYGLNADSASVADAFLALPSPMMGMEYFLIGSTSSSVPGESGSFFVIMGIYDDTFVSLQLRGSLIFRNDLHKAGSSVEFTVNRHQALYLVSLDDQSGTHILASKPISIMSGSTSGLPNLSGGSEAEILCGPNIEHLPPVERWGREYVVPLVRGNDRTSARSYIMASREGSTLTLSDGSLVSLSAGNIHEINTSQVGMANAIIKANKPILVYQMNDFSLTLVPNVDEIENPALLQDISIPLPTINHYGLNDSLSLLNLVAPCSSTANVTLISGGSVQEIDWSRAVSSSQFCVAAQPLVPGMNYRVEPRGPRVSVLLSGVSHQSGYASPGNM